MIKKLNPKHLERLLNNKCDVKLYQEGLSEEGEPLTSLNIENIFLHENQNRYKKFLVVFV